MDDLGISISLRKDIEGRILKRIDSLVQGYRQNIAVLGSRGMGKTPFLTSMFSLLAHRKNIIPIYIQAESLDYVHFVEKWLGGHLWGYFSSQTLKPSENLEELFQAAEPRIPKTIEAMRRIRKLSHKERNATAVKELFSLTGLLSEETGKQIVLMINEFHELESLPVTDPFGLLGKEIMIEKNTLYLVTSSRPQCASEILRDKLTLLFGNFETIHFPPFGFRETINFLKWCLPGCSFSPAQRDFLIRMTDGYPLHLRVLADEMMTRMRAQESGSGHVVCETKQFMRDNQVIEAFHRELFDSRGRLSLVFEKQLDFCRYLAKDSSLYLKVLIALSHGKKKLISISSFIGKRTVDTKKVLTRLIKEEMIVKCGSFYLIEAPLFRFWLREVFEKRDRIYTPSSDFLRTSLYDALRRELEMSRSLMDLPQANRIEALLKEFHNDVVEINQKKIKCPQFSEIQLKPIEGNNFSILAKNSKIRWLCHVISKQATEEDVLSYIEEIARYRKNVPQRIMIVPNGIDQNAKLMAHEAKIKLWDLKILNALYDVYQLPKMVLLYDEPIEELPLFSQASLV